MKGSEDAPLIWIISVIFIFIVITIWVVYTPIIESVSSNLNLTVFQSIENGTIEGHGNFYSNYTQLVERNLNAWNTWIIILVIGFILMVVMAAIRREPDTGLE